MIRFARIREITFGPDKDVGLGWIGSALALTVLPLVDDTGAFHFGNGTKDLDVKAFLGSTGEFALFDVGNSRLELARVPLYWSGTLTGKGLNFNDAVFPAGSSNNILSFGDGVGAKSISITDYNFLIRLNVVNDTNPSAERLFSWLFLKFAQITNHQANLDFQGLGLTCELSKNIGYAHTIDSNVNIVESLTVSMSLHAGKFGIDRATGKTVTGSTGEALASILAQISGAGISTGFGVDGGEQGAVMEAKLLNGADVTSMLWLNLLNGTTSVHGITVGNGGSGNITNLFWFVNADQGNCVDISAYSDGSQDSDGLIRVLIGSVAYFIPVFAAAKVTGEW